MTGRVLLMAFILASMSLRAQENPARLDSILPLLDPARKDTLQLTMLIAVCESWTTSQNAVPYLRRLDALSADLLADKEPKVQRRARHARGAYLYFTGYQAKFARNLPLALSSFEQAIADFEAGGHHHAVGECLDALGLVYGLAGAQDRAESAFRRELSIGREIGHDLLKTQALVHLASVSASHGQYTSAWAYLDSCGRGEAADSSMVLNERARIRELQGRGTEAERLLRQSLTVAARSDNAWDSLPALTPLARRLYADHRYSDGLRIAMTCAGLAERMGDATAQCGCINLVADGHRYSGDPATAARWYEKGLALAEAIGNIGVARELGDEGSMLYAAHGLKEAYRSLGRTADALAMTERWSLLKDSVEQMNGREDVLRSRYREEEFRDSLAHAESTRLGSLQHGLELRQERTQRNVIIGVCALAIALALALWSRFRFARRANATILEAQAKLVDSERAREASEVRTRIARDVHDQLGSDLTKLVMLSTEAKEAAKTDTTELHGIANDIERIAGEANRSLGDIVWAIDPHHDSLAGLTERVRAHCQRMLKWSKVEHTVDCVHVGLDRTLDPATKRDIYLIVREALNNAIKYAQAEHISVRFHTSPTDVQFEVKDDGVGISGADDGGHGLENMKHRARRVGGIMELQSSEGQGTHIRFRAALVHV